MTRDYVCSAQSFTVSERTAMRVCGAIERRVMLLLSIPAYSGAKM